MTYPPAPSERLERGVALCSYPICIRREGQSGFHSSNTPAMKQRQRADQIIRKLASRAGFQRNVHAHLFRHGYAINFLNCGGRLDALQEQLGHRDINTTRIYLRLTDEDIKREVAKVHF